MALAFKHRLAVFLLDMISKTWKITIKGNYPPEPAIVAFWHGSMLPAWKSFSEKNPSAVVSMSKDGEMLSALLQKWNFNLLRGSSSKNGKEVLDTMCDLAQHSYVLVTPDGPRGPIYKFKAGAAVTAKRTGTPVVLCSVQVASKNIFERSWDHFALPFPFTKIEITFSEPHFIEQDCPRDEVDKIITQLEQELNQMNGII